MATSATNSNRDPVEEIAEEFIERFRNGQRPSLTEYTSKHPELAEQIRELFPALVLIERYGNDTSGDRTAPSAQVLSQLGEYRILREVGRGGMGVIYEAVQESLGRRVALKVLPYHTLMETKALQRFQQESRAAANPHHTNIVPVFGVGEQDGFHYYAMQFIHGQSLDQVMIELAKLRHPDPATAADAYGQRQTERLLPPADLTARK